jgi:GAF domain-containing protein
MTQPFNFEPSEEEKYLAQATGSELASAAAHAQALKTARDRAAAQTAAEENATAAFLERAGSRRNR